MPRAAKKVNMSLPSVLIHPYIHTHIYMFKTGRVYFIYEGKLKKNYGTRGI